MIGSDYFRFNVKMIGLPKLPLINILLMLILYCIVYNYNSKIKRDQLETNKFWQNFKKICPVF